METVVINGIYKHWKEGYYRVKDTAYNHANPNNCVVIYYYCDENGIFKTKYHNGERVKQPFYRRDYNFTDEVVNNEFKHVKRFTYIKQARIG